MDHVLLVGQRLGLEPAVAVLRPWCAERLGMRNNSCVSIERGHHMAAMKPRTGDGPMEAVKEGRLIIVRVPLEGGGRLVVSVNDAEAKELHDALAGVVSVA